MVIHGLEAVPDTERIPARQPRIPANRWSVLTLLCFSLLLIAIDATVLHIAVPALTASLQPSATQLLWIIDAYSLVVAPLLVTFGTLGDRFGRRRFILAGYVVFGIASVTAAFAPTPLTLIASRALLGIGGAMIMPATLSLIRQVFTDRRERAIALGIWSAVAAAGAAMGPLIGGLLVEHFWWGAVFLINVPLLIIAFPLAIRLLPESRERAPHSWDAVSAVLSTLGVLGIALGVKELGTGHSRLPAYAAMLAGALVLWWFTNRQRRLRHPLLDIGLFTNRTFSTAVACVLLAIFALVGLELMIAQYLQLVLGDSPLTAGVRMLPLMVAAVSAGLLSAGVLVRYGVRVTMSGGLALTAVCLLPGLWFGTEVQPLLLALCFAGVGFGIETSLLAASDVIMSSVAEERAGGAAAIEETAYELGAGLGVAVLGTVTTMVYQPHLGPVDGIPSASMAEARESLAAAAHAAHTLPDGSRLLGIAREAFMTAFHSTVLVSLALLALTAGLAAVLLNRHRA